MYCPECHLPMHALVDPSDFRTMLSWPYEVLGLMYYCPLDDIIAVSGYQEEEASYFKHYYRRTPQYDSRST